MISYEDYGNMILISVKSKSSGYCFRFFLSLIFYSVFQCNDKPKKVESNILRLIGELICINAYLTNHTWYVSVCIIRVKERN